MRAVLILLFPLVLLGCEYFKQRGVLEDDRESWVRMREEVVMAMSSVDESNRVGMIDTLDNISREIDHIDDRIAILDAARRARRTARVTTAVEVTGAIVGDKRVGVLATALGGPAATTGLALLSTSLGAWATRRKDKKVVPTT